MNLQQLEYIIALDNYRHYVTAAEKCAVSQPALTIQVKKLEEELNIQLFDRSKLPLKPTQAGKEIIARARQALREINHIREYVLNEKNSLKGTVKLGIIPTLAPYILPLFLPAFQQACPECRLVIEEMQTFTMIEQLNTDQLDIALMATPTGHPQLREVPLFYEPFVGYIPSSHPLMKARKLSLKDLQLKELLLLHKEYCYSSQLLEICNTGRSRTPVLKTDIQTGSIETLKNLVKAGQGFTLIPELSTQDDPQDARIKRFPDPQPAREIGLVVHQSFPKEVLLKKLSEAILSNIPKQYRKNDKYSKIRWNDSSYLKIFES